MNKLFFLLACQLRLMNLFYHSAHNLASGPTFESDHEMFLEFYEAVDGDYDDVVERSIGMDLKEPSDLVLQMQKVNEKLQKLPQTNSSKERFNVGLSLEEDVCKICDIICDSPDVSSGVEQLVGDICNKSEIRQYKIKQRLK